MNIRLTLCSLAASAALCAMAGTTRAQIFVTNFNAGTIGEYTTSGVPVNPALITALSGPSGIAVSGGDLFVTNVFSGTIGEYTTFGVPVNATLITGLNGPNTIAVSGGNLFVASGNPMSESSRIGEYTTTGATVNPALIPDAGVLAEGIAVSGDKLFVVNAVAGTIGEYTTSGATVNAALVSGLHSPNGIAVFGGDLFVLNFGTLGSANGTIGEYTTSGVTVNAALVSRLNGPVGIAVVSASVPDASSTWALLLLGLMATFGLKPLLRRPA